ncbi:MAG: hypothetical protein ACYCVG_07735 [Leptospirillum sp.]|jgi:hypothetical protein
MKTYLLNRLVRKRNWQAVLALFLFPLSFLLFSQLSWGASREHLFYPSSSPQYASQLDIESVAMAFWGNNLLLSDTRHEVIFLNISGESMTVPVSGGKDLVKQEVLPGQAVVVAGNGHSAPLPEIRPGKAFHYGILPLGMAVDKDIAFIADGNGTIDALNVSMDRRHVYVIPPIGNTGAIRGHVTRMIQRTGLNNRLLGEFAPLTLSSGQISVIAGGGNKRAGTKPIDAFSCRISPVAIANDGNRIYIVGQTGRVYFLNEARHVVDIPVKENGETRWVHVPTGMIVLVAGGGTKNTDVDLVPLSAVESEIAPTSIAVHHHHILLGDSGDGVLEVNVSGDHQQILKSDSQTSSHQLEPGEIVSVTGSGNQMADTKPMEARLVGIHPKSLVESASGILFLAEMDDASDAGKVEVLNAGSSSISIPEGGAPHGLSNLSPGQVIVLVGNGSKSPVPGIHPDIPTHVGIVPVTVAFHNGLLAIADLNGSIDVVNMGGINREVHPMGQGSSVILPRGRIISLMGARSGNRSKGDLAPDVPSGQQESLFSLSPVR